MPPDRLRPFRLLPAAALQALLWLSPPAAPLAAQEAALPARQAGTAVQSPGSAAALAAGSPEADDLSAPPSDDASGREDVAPLLQEARGALLSPADPARADGEAYLALVEKATVLYFRAAASDPSDVRILSLLGRLAEIRALFAPDPWERRELLDLAQNQFLRAARLEFERAFDLRAARTPPRAPAAPQGPLIAELAYPGRLRRGEATLEDLRRHHGSEALPAERNPGFWRDRLHVIQAADDASQRGALYDEAAEGFAEVWRTMPVEVPWSGAPPAAGSPKIRKIEALQAWAGTVLALSASETDPRLRERLYGEALRLLELGLALPLDRHEMGGLLSAMDRAEPEAPDDGALQALWGLKDRFFKRWESAADRPPEALALWGDDLYGRADRQKDPRLFGHYLAEGAARYASYLELVRKLPPSPAATLAPGLPGTAAAAPGKAPARPSGSRRGAPEGPSPEEAAAALEAADRLARARFRHGEALEFRTGRMTALMLGIPHEDWARRRTRVLLEAAGAYREALNLEPGSMSYARALSRAYLSLAQLSPTDAGFFPYFEQALALALSAASREPDSGGAFFAWGRSLLALENLPGPASRERTVTEALAAFRQNLRSHSPFVPELNEMADLAYRAAQDSPAQKAQAYSLLSEICRRLAALRPDDPSARFALALATRLRLSAESQSFRPYPAQVPGPGSDGAGPPPAPGPEQASPAPGEAAGGPSSGPAGPQGPSEGSPDGAGAAPGFTPEAGAAAGPAPENAEEPHFTGGQAGPGAPPAPLPAPGTQDITPSPWAAGADSYAAERRGFTEMLRSAWEGLELLSEGAENVSAEAPAAPDPLEPFRRDPARLRFLEPENFLRVSLSSSTRPERNAASLNSFLCRLLDLAPPEGLPPWHRLQLGSFLRKAASSGYLPPEETAAYFRLALRELDAAERRLRSDEGDPRLLALILSEKGLTLAESTLSEGGASPAVLDAAFRLWDEADALLPSCSGYSRARWAAWSGGRDELAASLPHSARDEDVLLWPRFAEALQEPAFRKAKGEDWFKALWFGYSFPAPAEGEASGRP
jgi:hypothetical protein